MSVALPWQMKTRPLATTGCVVGVVGVVVLGGLRQPGVLVGAEVVGEPPVGVRELAEPATLDGLSQRLLTVQRGSLPIILSATHGGSVRVAGSKDREKGVTVRDVNTAEMALLVAQRLTEILGERPSFVVAQFSRKDADANRGEAEAFENEAAGAEYRAYHRALRMLVDECRAKHGGALLVDLHGQVRVAEAIVRGTRNGETMKGAIAKHGRGVVDGPESIFGRLKKDGYVVLPAIGEDAAPEEGAGRETFFDGGFIVAHYGSQHEDGVDAIQIEVGSQRSNALLKTSRDLAEAIAGYARSYMQPWK